MDNNAAKAPFKFTVNSFNQCNAIDEDIIQNDVKEDNILMQSCKSSFSAKSLFNQSDTFKVTSTKKRKPFENISFSESNNFNNKSFNSENVNNDNSLLKSTNSDMSLLNKSCLTSAEKSMILAEGKKLSKATLKKAKLFNKEFDKSTPFWIKFFEDIENGTLKESSSYYKCKDKSEYVASLIEMVQRDADIYDKINKSKKVKQETQNTIKKLLDDNNDTNNKSSTSVLSNNYKDDVSNNSRLEKIFDDYTKINEREKDSFSTDIKTFDEYKLRILTGGDFVENKEKGLSDGANNQISNDINSNNTNNNDTNNANNDNTNDNDNNDNDSSSISNTLNTDTKKGITNLIFPENYTYKELNYDEINFKIFDPTAIRKLLSLDKRLHEIDPATYNTSINTVLKNIRDDIKANEKLICQKAEIEAKSILNKFESKGPKETIFSKKPENQSKIKYKNYLKEEQEKKKEKKDFENKLKAIDQQIKEMNAKNISKEEIENFIKANAVSDNTNFKGELLDENLLETLKDTINNYTTNLIKTKEDITKKEAESDENKFNAEDIETNNFIKSVIESTDKLNQDLNDLQNSLKVDNDKLCELETKTDIEEQHLLQAQQRIQEMLNKKEYFDKLFEQADKLFYDNAEIPSEEDHRSLKEAYKNSNSEKENFP